MMQLIFGKWSSKNCRNLRNPELNHLDPQNALDIEAVQLGPGYYSPNFGVMEARDDLAQMAGLHISHPLHLGIGSPWYFVYFF